MWKERPMKNKYVLLQGFQNVKIVKDEKTLKEIFGDNYDTAVALEQDLQKSDPNYIGDGIPFVAAGIFMAYQQGEEEFLEFPMQTSDGVVMTKMKKSAFELQVNNGDWDGLPMHKGHTSYPSDPHEWKEPFGSTLKAINTPEGAFAFMYVLPSEPKMRLNIKTGAAIGFDKSPVRDLSAQFLPVKMQDTEVLKIRPTSVDVVYKKLAAKPGSGFQAILNQKNNSMEEKMDRKELFKTLTVTELKESEHTKPLVLKLQEEAREGYVLRSEIVAKLQNDEVLRKEVAKCPEVVQVVKMQIADTDEKIKKFNKEALSFLTDEKKVEKKKATVMLQKLGEQNEYDLEKFKGFIQTTEDAGLFAFQAGASEGDEDQPKQTGDQPNATQNFIANY